MRARLAALFLVAALASSCELFEKSEVQTTLDMVRNETGVDFTDPVSVARGAAGAGIIGDTAVEGGLDAARGYQREVHTQRGDILNLDGRNSQARDEYRVALNWATERPYEVTIPIVGTISRYRAPGPAYVEQIAEKRAWLYMRIGGTYMNDAAGRPEGQRRSADYELAAAQYTRAASEASDTHTRARAYYLAAVAYQGEGKIDQMCAQLRSSVAADPSGPAKGQASVVGCR